MSKTITTFVTFPLPLLSRHALIAAFGLISAGFAPVLGQDAGAPVAAKRAYQTTPGRTSNGQTTNRQTKSVVKSTPAAAPVVVARPNDIVVKHNSVSNTKLGTQAMQDKAKELNREAIALQSEGKLSEACALYRQAINLNGAGAGYHNNLALVLKDLDQAREAEVEERIALRLRPKRADYHVNLGIILQRQRRNTEAEASFKEALSMDAADSDCHFRLGQTYLDMGAHDKAVEESKLSIMLKPDNSDYRELMGDIWAKSEKWDDAMNEYRRVIELRSYTPATISGVFQAKIDAVKSHIDQK